MSARVKQDAPAKVGAPGWIWAVPLISVGIPMLSEPKLIWQLFSERFAPAIGEAALVMAGVAAVGVAAALIRHWIVKGKA